MDVASAVWTLTNSIFTIIAAHDDKTTSTKNIQILVQLIQQNLRPLFSHPNELEANEPLKANLLVLQKALDDTQFHLRLWSESRTHQVMAWFRPSVVTQQLNADYQLLLGYYQLLMGAVQFVDRDRFHGYNIISSPTQPFLSTPLEPPSKERPFLITPTNPPRPNAEVTDFWHRCIGNEYTPANAENFCDVLSAYLAHYLSPAARKRLLLRLDESKTGYISFSTFQTFMKGGKLLEAVKSSTKDPQLPLLIWIDDDFFGNVHEVLEATKLGVTVVQLASTSTAKAWIAANEEFLKEHDSPAHVRYISDQVRTEPGADGAMFTNRNAGYQIMKFIRDQGFKAPILIYTDSKSIELTHYVENYKMVGSVTHPSVVTGYIAGLGARWQDDKGWRRFNA